MSTAMQRAEATHAIWPRYLSRISRLLNAFGKEYVAMKKPTHKPTKDSGKVKMAAMRGGMPAPKKPMPPKKGK